MSNSTTTQQLCEMRLSAMAREFENQLQDPMTYNKIPFETRIGMIVTAEWNKRENNRLAAAHSRSKTGHSFGTYSRY